MECGEKILSQLRHVHGQWEATHVVIGDYQVALQRSLELEVRTAQLKKENEELRDECQDKDNTITELTCQIVHAQEGLKEELKTERVEKEEISKDRQELQEKLSAVCEKSDRAEERVKALENENAQLKGQLDAAREDTSVAVSEMQASKTEAEKVWFDFRQIEAENRTLLDKIKSDQQNLVEKMQEVTEMEEEVQRHKTEVERIRSQLSLGQEIDHASSFTSLMKRKQNPFAKRLAAYARLVEKGEVDKVVQALDVLMIEMKDYKVGANRSHSMNLKGVTDGDFFVLETAEEEESSAWKSTATRIPTEAHEAQRGHHGGCTSCAVSSMAQSVATGGEDHHVMIWDPATLTLQAVLGGMAEGVRDVSFTSNGDAILGAGADKSVRVWKVPSGRMVHTMTGHSRSVNCVACDPGDPYKAISSSEDRHILFWDLNRGYRVQHNDIKLEEWTNAVCFVSVGYTVASGHSRGSLRLWDIRSSKEALCHPSLHNDAIVAVSSLPLSTHLLLTAGRDNRLTLFDVRNDSAVQSFHDPQFSIGTMSFMGKGKSCVDISREERYICAGSTSGAVMIWDKDGANDRCIKKLSCPFQTESVTATAWANDRLFSCDRSGKIVVWS